MSQIALHIRVTGMVQGVFFRAWTAERARALGVVGWVRNASDGSVEGHLEGDKSAVQQLVDQLHRGPPSARVAAVDAEVSEPIGADGFEVRH
jgi:acylphosphatase